MAKKEASAKSAQDNSLSQASAHKPKQRLSSSKSLAFQVRRTHLAFARLLESRLSRHDVKVGYWYYLRALGLKDNVTQKYLSDVTKVTETTTAAILRAMAEQGLIERVKDTVDRRQTFIKLTPEGRALEEEISPYADDLNMIAREGISLSDLQMCLSVLSRISVNLEDEIVRCGI